MSIATVVLIQTDIFSPIPLLRFFSVRNAVQQDPGQDIRSKAQRATSALVDHAREGTGATLGSYAARVGLETSDLGYYKKKPAVQALILSAQSARAAEVAHHSKKQSSSSSSSSSSAASADIYKDSFKEGTLRVSKGEKPMKVSNDLRQK